MHIVIVTGLLVVFLVLVYGFIRFLVMPVIRGTSYDDGYDDAPESDGAISMIGATVGTAVGSIVAAQAVQAFERRSTVVANDDPPAIDDPPPAEEVVTDNDADEEVSDD